MTDEQLPISMRQAPEKWKFMGFFLLVPVVGLGLYGGSRFLIATFLIASEQATSSNSLYQLFCLPAIIFLTPVLTIGAPIVLVREATKEQIRNLVIISIVFLVSAVLMMIFLPEWSQVLWGI